MAFVPSAKKETVNSKERDAHAKFAMVGGQVRAITAMAGPLGEVKMVVGSNPWEPSSPSDPGALEQEPQV